MTTGCDPILRGVARRIIIGPTVCPEFDVAQLADHLIGTATFLGAVAFAGAGSGAVPGPLATRAAVSIH